MKDRTNLEQQLADKLGSRSIAPGEQAWERIVRNRQQGKNNKKKKRSVAVYAVASVILLMLFAGYFFMTENSESVVIPQVVNADTTDNAVDTEASAVPETILQPKQTEVAAASSKIEMSTDFPDVYKEEIATISESYKDVQVKESLPYTSIVAVSPVKALTKEEQYEKEADDLLKNAIKDVAAKKLLSNPTNDAALLKEVESEMDDYYRDKAMRIFALKNKKIRFAVKN